jgi:peptidyl-tRNA hydrolase
MSEDMDRLYVVVRSDLPSGTIMVQSCHAAVDWCLRYVGQAARWRDHGGNNLVILSVPDEPALLRLHAQAEAEGWQEHLVREPDLGGEATAFAVEEAARRRLSSLPLALRARNAEAAMA